MRLIYKLILILAVLAYSGNFTAFAASQSVAIQYSAVVPETLSLSVSGSGSTELRFGNLLAGATSEPMLIRLDVISNSGNPYTISHALTSSLQNSSGDVINASNIGFSTRSINGIGSPVVGPTPMSGSDQAIYASNATGASDQLEVSYRLSIPGSQPPGDYSSNITFTVSTT